MSRFKPTAVVSAGHSNYTGMTEVAVVADAPYVDVTFTDPRLAWLGTVSIEVTRDGKVQVKVVPAAEDASPRPTMTVQDGHMTVSTV